VKILVVGDPHIKPGELDEAWRLVGRIEEVAVQEKPDYILLLGDLFHNFGLVHVEVLHFWTKALNRLSGLCRRVIALRGNHDGPHDPRAGVHALASLGSDRIEIVDEPTIIQGVMFMPYFRDADEFLKAVGTGAGLACLYCHQEFDGCRYDNGFYAPNGVDPEKVPVKTIISGHIHTGQEFGKVWFPGAPRWMSVSDANQDRFLWLVEHGDDGTVWSRKAFPTDPACQRLVHIDDRQEAPADPAALKPEWRVAVDITGDAAWVKERQGEWRGRARIRTFVIGSKNSVVRESDGISVAFTKFLSGFAPKNKTAADRLAGMAKERLAFV
jgi:DNA repair exonuclease SbcCD nuclease subunit